MRTESLRRLTALSLCLLILTGVFPPARADENEIHISSISDWEALTKSCMLDTWSQGKTVILDCDLELTGEEIIPTFGGSFDGQNHTISGLNVRGEGSQRGLFRYIQEGGTVKDLNVTGTVAPAGDIKSTGGIAGVNHGTISQCTFSGRVEGMTGAGGIAGVNEAEGRIISCTSSGTVLGSHYTGGIVGENYGSIISCVNEARVNTQAETPSTDLDSFNWEDINSTENIPACTDTGGIAGYSRGLIEGCSNNGDVGYPHTGYNVGGIAGRQAGYINGCTNSALIQGRKEVGGIMGQLEPYTQLRYEEDTLQQLLNELDVLSEMLSGTVSSTNASRQQVSAYLKNIGQLTGSAKEDITGMIDAIGDWGGGTVDTINELSVRVSRVISQSGPVLDDLNAFSSKLGEVMEQLNKAIETGQPALGDIDSSMGYMNSAMKSLQNASDLVSEASSELGRSVEYLQEALQITIDKTAPDSPNDPNPDDSDADNTDPDAPSVFPDPSDIIGSITDIVTDDAFQACIGNALTCARSSLSCISSAMSGVDSAMTDMRNALEDLRSGTVNIDSAADELQIAIDLAAESTELISSALTGISAIVDELSQQPTLEIPKLDSSYYEMEDSLNSTLDSMGEEIKSMGSALDRAGDVLSSDLQGISAQFKNITQVLRDAQSGDPTETEIIVDVSDTDDGSITMGKASGCVNYGGVEGDVNVGGIAGSMSIEFDFDPEDDIAGQRSSGTSFQYLTRAILRDSENRGSIVSRKDCAGGVVGYMDLGMVIACRGFGDVESTDGEYVGGVAGISEAVIRSSWAKCALTGSNYVGGIAGQGNSIADCGAMVDISEDATCSGAIAGQAEGTLTNNRFVSDSQGGVDGISYTGKAEPADYSTFMQLPNVPSAYNSFTLTFEAMDEPVLKVDFSYGDSIPESRFPAVPTREGFYGAWEEFDSDNLCFDTVVKAVYTPWLTALSDSGNTVLAEGSFTPGTTLSVSESKLTPPALEEGEQLRAMWSISIDQPNERFTALRIKSPEDMNRTTVWVCGRSDGKWTKATYTVEGSYLRIELEGSAADICVTEPPVSRTTVIALICGGAALVLLILIIILRKRQKRRRKSRETPEESPGEAPEDKPEAEAPKPEGPSKRKVRSSKGKHLKP